MKRWIGLVVFFSFLLIPGTAFADVEFCESNEDCSVGFKCQLECISSCPECDDCVQYAQCIRDFPSCDDQDCPDGLTCLVRESGSCSGFDGCGPGDDEDCLPPPPECEYFTEAICVLPYEAPCEVAADCGPGFTCEALDTSVCHCSAPTPGSDEDQECICEDGPEGESYCQLVVVECVTDQDCDHDFECIALGQDVPRLEPVCNDDGECHGVEPMEEPLLEARQCAPRGFELGVGPGSSENERPGIDNDGELPPSELGTGGVGNKPEPGCHTASGSASLVLLLLALVGVVRRRPRHQFA